MDKSLFQIKPSTSNCNCIICHKKGVPFSDEHIIPKSLGGYMHTWNVCKECNSKFGQLVDIKLSDHYLMRWERYIHQIKGESGKPIPNPLTGTLVGDDGKNYRIEDIKGILTPRVLPKITLDKDGRRVSLAIDSRDKGQAADILTKYCKRNSFSINEQDSQIVVEKTSQSPRFNYQVLFDISDFRIGMLKIAYEFAVSLIPPLEADPIAVQIASLLKTSNTSGLDKVTFAGSGFEDIFQKIFGNVIDFSKDTRHYIFLTNLDGSLFCFVKLFNVFCIGVKLSDQEYKEANAQIIAINDFKKSDFDLYSLEELIAIVSSFENLSYTFLEPYNSQLKHVCDIDGTGFACDEEGQNICFYNNGRNFSGLNRFLESCPEDIITTKIEDSIAETVYNLNGAACFLLKPYNTFLPIEKIVMTSVIKKI